VDEYTLEVPSLNERNVPSGLRWTGQNTDFIELIYGLHTKKCINDGDVSLKEMTNELNWRMKEDDRKQAARK